MNWCWECGISKGIDGSNSSVDRSRHRSSPSGSRAWYFLWSQVENGLGGYVLALWDTQRDGKGLGPRMRSLGGYVERVGYRVRRSAFQWHQGERACSELLHTLQPSWMRMRTYYWRTVPSCEPEKTRFLYTSDLLLVAGWLCRSGNYYNVTLEKSTLINLESTHYLLNFQCLKSPRPAKYSTQ